MDWCKFVSFDFSWTALSDFYHLSQLFVTDECLINLQDGLLEDEVDWVSHNFLGI